MPADNLVRSCDHFTIVHPFESCQLTRKPGFCSTKILELVKSAIFSDRPLAIVALNCRGQFLNPNGHTHVGHVCCDVIISDAEITRNEKNVGNFVKVNNVLD